MLPSIPVRTAVQKSLSPPRSIRAVPTTVSYTDDTMPSRNEPT